MKKNIFFSLLLVSLILVFCSKEHPTFPDSPDVVGSLQVSINMGKVGALQKATKTERVEMTKLYVALSAEGQSTIYDTLLLTGGSQERTERKTYSGLAAWIDGQIVEWTLNTEARDQLGQVIYSGDTIFVVPPQDTAEIALFLKARYSMLVANFLPIRDSVTRCVLDIDGNGFEADSSFPKQSLLGDTVTLSYDYMTASPSGISHHIDLNVYGQLLGIDTLLYTGDTTITVQSGEDKNYRVILKYVGPNTLHGAATMVVTLGKVGTITINGDLMPKELLLWNKLGSQFEVENSVIGPNGIFGGGEFIPGKLGNAFQVSNSQDWLVSYPGNALSVDSGCIEFWAKLSNMPEVLKWGPNPCLIILNNNNDQSFIVHLNGNDGRGNGGLCGRVGGRVHVGTGSYSSTWKYSDVLGIGGVEQWHHYALVWNEQGIAAIGNVTVLDSTGNSSTMKLCRCAIYLNGKLNTAQWLDFGGLFNAPENSRLRLISNSNLSQGTVAIDNLKVWNFSKTDFSDRFTE